MQITPINSNNINFNGTYKGIKIIQDGVSNYSPETAGIVANMNKKAVQLLQDAVALIEPELKVAAETKIPGVKPVEFEIKRASSGTTSLRVNYGQNDDLDDLGWCIGIMPEKGYDVFNNYAFLADGQNGHKLTGFYLKSAPNINKGNTGDITYKSLTDSTPENIAGFLKKIYIDAIDKIAKF